MTPPKGYLRGRVLDQYSVSAVFSVFRNHSATSLVWKGRSSGSRSRLSNSVISSAVLGFLILFSARKMCSSEMGMYICQATGAFPYTNLKFRWKEILSAREDLDPTAQVWSPLTNAFQQLQFKFLDKVDSKFACSIRQDGRLEGFRSYLRKIWNSVGGEPDLGKSESLARDFRDELTQTYNESEAEWGAIDRDLVKYGGATVAGAIAMGKMSLGLPAAGFAIAGIAELIQTAMKKRAFRKRVPMSVFIDLANR